MIAKIKQIKNRLHFSGILSALISILMCCCDTGTFNKGNEANFKFVYSDLWYAGSNQIQVSTSNSFQFYRYTEGQFKKKLMLEAGRSKSIDSNNSYRHQLIQMKAKSLAYLRYYVGMSDSERSCFEPILDSKPSNAEESRLVLVKFLRERSNCLFESLGENRIDSLLLAAPYLNNTQLKYKVKIEKGEQKIDSFLVELGFDDTNYPGFKGEIKRKIKSRHYTQAFLNEVDSITFNNRKIVYKVINVKSDSRLFFSVNQERIYERLKGDLINSSAKNAWEALQEKRRYKVAMDIKKSQLDAPNNFVVASEGAIPILTMRELSAIINSSPMDSNYSKNLNDYVEYFGIWKLGSQEYDELNLSKIPYLKYIVTKRDDEFIIQTFREDFYSELEKAAKGKVMTWKKLPWEKEISTCKDELEAFSPKDYNLIFGLPFEFFKSSLIAYAVSEEPDDLDNSKCLGYYQKLNAKAYEFSAEILSTELKKKYHNLNDLFTPYLEKLDSFEDSLNFAQKAYQAGETQLAISLLESLEFFNFKNSNKLSTICLFLARIKIENGDFQQAVFHLELSLLLTPPSATMLDPFKLLLAIYEKDKRNPNRRDFWRNRYIKVNRDNSSN